MSAKIFLVIATIVAVAVPTMIALTGYLMLTSHLQGAAAAVLGWILFFGGFFATIPAAAVVVELRSQQSPTR